MVDRIELLESQLKAAQNSDEHNFQRWQATIAERDANQVQKLSADPTNDTITDAVYCLNNPDVLHTSSKLHAIIHGLMVMLELEHEDAKDFKLLVPHLVNAFKVKEEFDQAEDDQVVVGRNQISKAEESGRALFAAARPMLTKRGAM